jgi:hypothetical protein
VSLLDRVVEPPPAVTTRMHFTPPALYVDQFLDRLGGKRLDLSDAQQRAHLRHWMVNLLDGYLRSVEWELAKAAERGVHQAVQLLRDPSYYDQRRQQVARVRARNRQQQAEADAAWQARQRDADAEFDRLIAAGKVAIHPRSERRRHPTPIPAVP